MTKLERVVTEVYLPKAKTKEINTYVLTMDEKEAQYLKMLSNIEAETEGEIDPCLQNLCNSLRGVK